VQCAPIDLFIDWPTLSLLLLPAAAAAYAYAQCEARCEAMSYNG